MKYYLMIMLLFLSTIIFAQEKNNAVYRQEMKAFLNSGKFQKVQYPGDSNIDVTYYGLDLAITTSPNLLKGSASINLKITSALMNSFFLDLQDPLTVDSVNSNGKNLSFIHQNDKITFSNNSVFNIGEEIKLIIYYHGVPGSSGFGSFEFGSHNGQPAIYTLSEPYGTSDWFPCKDTPADKADSSDVWITCSNSLIPVSNGKLVQIIDNGNGTHTYKWKNHHPIAQYLISLAISNYTEYTTYYKYSKIDSLPIVHYIYPEHFNSVKPNLDLTADMIKVFSEKFGQYPYLDEKYGHAEFGWGGGMEHQTVSSMGAFSRDIISHELSHQWFGDKVTCKDWHHIWLNEGFATYAEGVYIESISGTAGYKSFINGEMNRAKNAQGTIYVQNISSINQIFDGNRSYAKGAVVLHMLRGITGENVFFNILKSYASDPALAYGVATTEDFQAVAESVSGLDLNYFFQEWIYGEGFPSYSLSWSKESLGNDLFVIHYNIEQAFHKNPGFFTMPIQLDISTSNGDTTITIFNNQKSQQFNITVSGNPISVTFDPDNFILKSISSVTDVNDELSLPAEFSLSQNYPNPFNPSTKIKYSIKEQGNVKLIVYDILGREVATLVNEQKPAGNYEVTFDASRLSSGVYFYRLRAGSFVSTKKMILLR